MLDETAKYYKQKIVPGTTHHKSEQNSSKPTTFHNDRDPLSLPKP